jgi:4-alpha-glucanotransferase
LHGRGPIGSLGQEARHFIDFLHASGFSWWQVCPIGPTGYGDSPYQALSVFASNPYLLDLADLVKRGLLKESEIAPLQRHGDEGTDYGRLWEQLLPLLKIAAERGAVTLKDTPAFMAYCQKQASWLDAWTQFSALREKHQFKAPARWPDLQAPENLRDEAAVLQFLFQQQWQALRDYAQQRGVTLFGDEPIYVSADGCDAKFNPELFQLDDNGTPTAVAGVPPDYFAADGQLWGNPLYRWERHQADQFKWWRSRIQHDLTFFDAIRIDHFRGLHDYWSVPAGAPNAREGQWCAGPDLAFTQAVGDLPLVAEDLGLLSPGVEVLRRASGLPGMSVLQFGFGGNPEGNPHYPDNITPDRIVYTGTHDNDTVVGWYKQLPEDERSALQQLYGALAEPHLHFAEIALNSPAIAAFIPAQDLLGLDERARFNTPGNPQGNWTWRLTNAQFDQLIQDAPTWKRRLETSQRLNA